MIVYSIDGCLLLRKMAFFLLSRPVASAGGRALPERSDCTPRGRRSRRRSRKSKQTMLAGEAGLGPEARRVRRRRWHPWRGASDFQQVEVALALLGEDVNLPPIGHALRGSLHWEPRPRFLRPAGSSRGTCCGLAPWRTHAPTRSASRGGLHESPWPALGHASVAVVVR